MSKSSDAFVGAAGMNDRKRGLSLEITAGASTLTNWSITSAGECPCSSMRDGASASDGRRHAMIERHRIQMQALRRVVEDATSEILGDVVEVVHQTTLRVGRDHGRVRRAD